MYVCMLCPLMDVTVYTLPCCISSAIFVRCTCGLTFHAPSLPPSFPPSLPPSSTSTTGAVGIEKAQEENPCRRANKTIECRDETFTDLIVNGTGNHGNMGCRANFSALSVLQFCVAAVAVTAGSCAHKIRVCVCVGGGGGGPSFGLIGPI